MTEPDPNEEMPPAGGQERVSDLGRAVDEMEERVTEERRQANVEGNVDDREKAEPVVSEDQAPE